MTRAISLEDLRASFCSLLFGFHQAESTAGRFMHTFGIGGRRVQIRSAGAEPLAALVPALSHLAIPENGATDITICAWHGGTLDRLSALAPPGIYVAPHHGMQMTVAAHPAVVTAYDARARLGVVWFAGRPTAYVHTIASPLRELLAAAVRPFGLIGLHAAAVGNEQGAALLAGAGGAGKSTSALACALAGMAYVAEDFCLVRPEPAPVVYSLYNSAKLSPAALAWLEPPADADTGRWVDEKRLFLLHRAPTVQIASSLPIRCVLVLRITGAAHSCLRPASGAEAVNALAPTSVRLMGLPAQAAPAVFHGAAAVVRQVRCYRLELGADLAAVPALVDAAIAGGKVNG